MRRSLVLATAAAFTPWHAYAQSEEPPPAAQTEEVIVTDDDEVVVTARRRTESLQDVPIAVSVLGAAELESTGTYNVGRLTQLQPTVQFFSSNPRNSAINIRGLGAPFGLTNDGIEQGVGLYIDQVYFARPAAASFDFVDIEQIEVLRGPQGTLYGKNTTAGALNITTRAPSFTPEGRFELTAGNLEFVQGKGSISGPLIDDKLAARFAVTGTSRRGTLLNTRTGSRVNAQSNIGLKGSLLWRFDDATDVTLSADFNRQNPECCAQVFARVAPTLRAANRQFETLAALSNYAPPSRDPFDRLTDVDSDLQAKQNFGGASLRVEWDAGPGTLTSVTAWRFWDWYPSNDRDFTGLPITTVSANPSKQRQLTHEIRYEGESKRLDYVAGVFAYRQVIDSSGNQEQGSAASLWLLGGAPASRDPAVLNGLRQESDIHFEYNALAAFGQLSWKVTDTLTVQPGLRLNYDDKSAVYNAVVTGGIANPTPAQQALKDGVLVSQFYAPSFSDFNVSGDLTLSWEPAEAVLLYGTYAKSFKSGGINLGGLPRNADGSPDLTAATVKPEKVDHFELGLKSQLLGRRVTLNLAAFRTEIEDYQLTVVDGAAGNLRGFLANAGKVRVQGVELDFTARLADGLSLYASGAYTDGEYVRFTNAPPPIELVGGPARVDISGQRLPGLSKWSASFGGEYGLPIGGNGREAYLGVDGSYRSSFSSNPTPSAFTDVEGYALFNFRLGYRDDDGWNVFGWLRNAFDEDYFEFLSIAPGNSGLIVGQPGDPRTYGVTVSRSF